MFRLGLIFILSFALGVIFYLRRGSVKLSQTNLLAIRSDWGKCFDHFELLSQSLIIFIAFVFACCLVFGSQIGLILIMIMCALVLMGLILAESMVEIYSSFRLTGKTFKYLLIFGPSHCLINGSIIWLLGQVELTVQTNQWSLWVFVISFGLLLVGCAAGTVVAPWLVTKLLVQKKEELE